MTATNTEAFIMTAEGTVGYSKMDDTVNLADVISVQQQSPVSERADHGLNVLTTCVFVVGVIAGSGFLALPKAIDNAGWIGFILMMFCCLSAAYTGKVLGESWTIVRARFPEFNSGHVRYPYPAIGQAAFGRFGRIMVSFAINFTMFGSSVVYLLLASDNISQILPKNSFSLCYICLIIGGALIPITWFGTPREFWGIAAGATLATGTASIIMLVNILLHGDPPSEVTHTEVDFVTFFTAFGTISFAFGGHPAFPTFQADMREPKRFGKAVFIGYTIVVAMYIPTSTAAYIVYGKKVEPNILGTVPQGPMSTIVSILMTLHLLFGIVIISNPIFQEVEYFLKIPEHFTWKRLVTRTLLLSCVIFVAESIPHFAAILSLVGGSTVTLLVYVFPSLFYLKLCRTKPTGDDEHWEIIDVPLHVKVVNYEMILIGILAGLAASYSAILDITTNKFTLPCYVDVHTTL